MWSRHTRHSATRLRRECGKQGETKQSHNSDEKSDDDVRKKKKPTHTQGNGERLTNTEVEALAQLSTVHAL